MQVIEILQEKYQKAKRSLRFYYLSVRFKIQIMSSLDTIDYIRNHQCSVARFGDGELNMIMSDKSIGFQRYDGALAERLGEVLVSDNPQLLRCLPHTLDRFCGEGQKARNFWIRFSIYNKAYISNLLKDHGMAQYRFGDTQMTRPYMDYINAENADRVYPALKRLWEMRDVLIVEGSKTRMGIGNDLFSGAASVKRILCPSENAFSRYNEILQTVRQHYSGQLVLIALGPTATVLASDLSKEGMWAVDVGHLDMEYEWFRSGAKEKRAIKGKYVNEVSGGNRVEICADETYSSQIIAEIIHEGE